MDRLDAFPVVDADGWVRLLGEVIGRVKRRTDGWDAVRGGGLVGTRRTRGRAVELLRVHANRGRFTDVAHDVRELLSRLHSDSGDAQALISIGMLAAVGICSMEPSDARGLIYAAADWAGLSPTFPRSACREVAR